MKQPNSHKKRSSGFALVISLTLMAFMIVLILSLATLLRIETNLAATEKIQMEARQNALLGMQIALAELQVFAGPDQRITARSDLELGPDAANPYWVGVYGNAIEPDYAKDPVQIATELTNVDTDRSPNTVNDNGSSAMLLNWLVSGNEVNPFISTANIGDDGNVIEKVDPDSIPYKPGMAVAGLTQITPATETNLTLGGQPARVMVGPGSAAKVRDYVVAPVVEVSTTDSDGGYAWWIGDEGVKASANLPLETNDSDKIYAFTNARRSAIELMADGLDDEEDLAAPTISERYDPNSSELSKLTNPMELAVISTDPNQMSAILKNRYHDISPQTKTVLSDAYAGGLKRDLSILLDESYIVGSTDPTADQNRMWIPHTGDIHGYTEGFGIPTWKHLRSFYQTRVPTSGSDAYELETVMPAHDKDGFDDHVGVEPVLTYFSIGFRAAPTADPAPDVPIHINLYPLVVLWNPYNFTLKGKELEVGFYPTYNVKVSLDVFREAPDADPEWTSIGYVDFQQESDGLDSNHTEYIRFRLDCPDIPPGQSLIFSLPHTSSGESYNQQNVLKNIEPEPSAYVHFPIKHNGSVVKIQPGEEFLDYRLVGRSSSTSFNRGGGGEANIYLGDPVSSRVSTGGGSLDQSDEKMNPSASFRRWHNAHQRIGWDGIVVDQVTDPDGTTRSVQQAAGPLVYDVAGSEPAFVFLAQALFGGYGQNAQLNTNQHMFTTRWIAQGNMRAVRSGRTRRDINYNPLFTATAGSPDVNTPWQKFNSGDGANSKRVSAGLGHDWINNQPVDAVLFEFPYEDQRLMSIGQLQHANLSLVGAYPSYPIGNSLADYRLHDAAVKMYPTAPPGYQLARIDHAQDNFGWLKELGRDLFGYYDISYLLNRTLWDQYYFSTIEPGEISSGYNDLKNPRMHVYDATPDHNDPDQTAAALMVDGGFNINSTSEQAWRAILGGANQLEYDPEDPNSSNPDTLKSAFSRFSRPSSDSDPDVAFQGFRELDDEQIAQLARNIVEEVRNRGPFTSLSDFVNRRLVDNPNTVDSVDHEPWEHEYLRGTIQAAIDRTRSSSNAGEYPVNDDQLDFWESDEITNKIQQTQFTHGAYDRTQLLGGEKAFKPISNRSAFAPNYLTQADVLSTIGANLSARSDTFVIRAYGEVSNRFNTGEPMAQVWCEAVVQRTPEYVDSSEDAHDDPVNPENRNFNRRFKIIAFRWLTPDQV